MKLANMIAARRNQTRIIVQQNQKRPYRRQSLFIITYRLAPCALACHYFRQGEQQRTGAVQRP